VLTDGPDGESTIIPLSELTAVFFVRDFAGDPTRVEDKFFSETHDRNMEMTLCNRQVMAGSTLSDEANGPGFFIQPADTQSNNLSVFVTTAGLEHLRFR
jgi:hypothetical protein